MLLSVGLFAAGVHGGALRSAPPRAGALRCRTSTVDIKTTGPNSRRISASIAINASPDDVWAIITDYDHISDYTPSVRRSRVVPSKDTATVRVFQESAQSIAGFEFRASLTMEMQELRVDALRRPLPALRLVFRCVESEMFSVYSGEFRVEPQGAGALLCFSVDVTPRGPVPVWPLGMRIQEDVPVNLVGLKAAAEARKQRQ